MMKKQILLILLLLVLENAHGACWKDRMTWENTALDISDDRVLGYLKWRYPGVNFREQINNRQWREMEAESRQDPKPPISVDLVPAVAQISELSNSSSVEESLKEVCSDYKKFVTENRPNGHHQFAVDLDYLLKISEDPLQQVWAVESTQKLYVDLKKAMRKALMLKRLAVQNEKVVVDTPQL